MASTLQKAELTTSAVADGDEDFSIFVHCIRHYFFFGSIFGGTIILLGLAGNSLTLVLMRKERYKSSTINCLFMLAIADSLVLFSQAFLTIPFGIGRFFWGWWGGHSYNIILASFNFDFMLIFNQVSAFLTMLVSYQRQRVPANSR
jgi:hypothetical protein